MKYELIIKAETREWGVVESTMGFKTFGDMLHEYNEYVHILKERYDAGELVDWDLTMVGPIYGRP